MMAQKNIFISFFFCDVMNTERDNEEDEEENKEEKTIALFLLHHHSIKQTKQKTLQALY